jgi:hypothetical protein
MGLGAVMVTRLETVFQGKKATLVCVQLAIDISNFFILRKKRALAG